MPQYQKELPSEQTCPSFETPEAIGNSLDVRVGRRSGEWRNFFSAPADQFVTALYSLYKEMSRPVASILQLGKWSGNFEQTPFCWLGSKRLLATDILKTSRYVGFPIKRTRSSDSNFCKEIRGKLVNRLVQRMFH